MNHEKLTRFPERTGWKYGTMLALGSLAAGAFLLDRASGSRARNKLSSEADFLVSEHEQSKRTIVVLPGAQSDGARIAKNLEPHLAPHGNLVFTDYPKAGFDVDRISNGLFETMQRNNLENPSFLANSMGGMVLANMLKQYEQENLEQDFGPVGTVVMDSSPHSYADLGPRSRQLLLLARIAGDSAAFNAIKNYEMRRSHPMGAATASTSTAVEQGKFMSAFAMPPGSLEGVAENVMYIDGPGDPVVNTAAAYEGWNKIYGGNVVRLTDYARPQGSHAESVKDYPEETVRQLAPIVLTAAS